MEHYTALVITDTFLEQCGIIITTGRPLVMWSPASLMGSWNLTRPTNKNQVNNLSVWNKICGWRRWTVEASRGGDDGGCQHCQGSDVTKLIVAGKQEITRSLSLNTMKESPVAIISLHHYVSWPGQRHGMTGLVASGGRWGWAYTPIIS